MNSVLNSPVAPKLSASEVLLQQICRCPSLPSLPSAVIEVLKATGRDDADLSRLPDIVSKDAALVARILRTVNSSHFALRHRITSISQALPQLGLRNLRTLVMGLSVFPAVKKCRPAVLNHTDYCRRSLYSATAARIWAERLMAADGDDCFISALLMDIGILAMAEAVGPAYAQVLSKAERHADLDSIERRQLGLTHAEVGACLARRWQLPAELIDPIRFHHDPGAAPEGPARTTARVARLAGLCADIFVEHNPLWPIAECYRWGGEDFALDRLTVDKIIEAIATETRRLGTTFEVTVDPAATFAQAQTRAGQEFSAASGTPPETHKGPEQRREVRSPSTGSIVIIPCAGPTIGKPCRALFCNVSPGGIGLITPHPLEQNSRFAIGLRRNPGLLTVVLYRVVHCRPDRGAYMVGAELVRAYREQELRAGAAGDDPTLHQIGQDMLRSPAS